MQSTVNNDRAVRMLYGENSGIIALDCTLCICVKCGSIYVEILPERCLDKNKMCHLFVEQAKNLDIPVDKLHREYVFCDECRKARDASNKSILEIGGFFLFVGVIVALTALFASFGGCL